MKTLYLTDNGALYCHDHLGHTAKATGRDLSGQPIERLTEADHKALCRTYGRFVDCETCMERRDRESLQRHTAPETHGGRTA